MKTDDISDFDLLSLNFAVVVHELTTTALTDTSQQTNPSSSPQPTPLPPMSPPPPRLLLLLLVFLSVLFGTGTPDLLSEQTALLNFRSAVGRYALTWNTSTSPCSWQGVACESGTVTVLRLPGVGLIGSIPVGIFGNLTSLRTLSLRFNALSGPLPSDIVSLVELRNLYLQNNRFSGEFQSGISGMGKLVRLSLADNALSGEIPDSVGELKRLGTLFLQNNRFTGQIPNLDLPNLVQFNVSFNQLNGSVPEKLQKMSADAFLGMSLCGGPLPACPVSDTPAPAPTDTGVDGGRKKLSGGAIAGIVIASIFAFFVILGLVIFLCRGGSRNKTRSLDATAVKPQDSELQDIEKRSGDMGTRNGGVPPPAASVTAVAAVAGDGPQTAASGGTSKKLVFFNGNGGNVFDLEDLLRASAEVLGKGTFGTAYKAVLETGSTVAVKRLKDVTLPEKDFKEKIDLVGAMQHPNLVPLRAYYYSRDEKLIVYDYMSNGSLSALLHGNRGAGRTPLNWKARCEIALSTAIGIEYIHSRDPSASHGNIKSSNILLTKNNEACVSDHGLAHLVSPTSMPNRVAGYRAPEVTDARKVSQKADVYSFGVLLLELLTGKAPAQALLNDEGVDLPRWVQSVVKEEWTSEVFDMELLRYGNVEDEMVNMLQLAIDCAAQYPDNRPAMSDVVIRIKEISNADHQNLETEDVAPPSGS